MNRFCGCLLATPLFLAAAIAQDDPASAAARKMKQDAFEMKETAKDLTKGIDAKVWKMQQDMNLHMDSFAAKPFLAPGFSPLLQAKRRTQSDERLYSAGSRALDNSRWDEAAKYFGEAADLKGSHAEGALYWKAYAENRLGQRETALATIASLRKDYPSSRWLNDAQALEVEIKQQSGKPVSPDAESNDELKMLALVGLLHSDPEQAVPLIDKLLRQNNSPKLKDRALFVLTQSSSAKAQQLLNDVAKGNYNPDLQVKAIRHIANSGGKDSRANLFAIYNSNNDLNVKREIVRIFMNSSFTGASDPLATIAKTEKNAELRREAVRTLGNINSAQTGDLLASMYPAEQDPDIKKEILNSLYNQQNAKVLVDIARKETNPEIKREIVQRLGNMRSKEATQYMLEILSK